MTKTSVGVLRLLTATIEVVLFLGYLFLAVFSEYWLGVTTGHGLGEDFDIYYQATLTAAGGGNPYIPYQIGTSFVNHPFVLSLVALVSGRWSRFWALRAWIAASAIAWTLVILISLRLCRAGTVHRSTHAAQRSRWVLLAYLGFAPFLETIHLGQINILVMLCLCLMIWFLEQDRAILSGICLAWAIVLKTSPVIFLLYYLARGKVRLLASCAASLFVLSVIPVVQFSPAVLADFVTVLPQLTAEIHPTVYNQSAPSLLFRTLGDLGADNLERALSIAHNVVALSVFATLSALAALGRSTRTTRLLEASLFLVAMTLFSPLVWYHHTLFLLFPLTLLIMHSNWRYALAAIGLIFVIQSERLFEYRISDLAWPVSLAGYALLGLVAWVYAHEWRQGRQQTGSKVSGAEAGPSQNIVAP